MTNDDCEEIADRVLGEYTRAGDVCPNCLHTFRQLTYDIDMPELVCSDFCMELDGTNLTNWLSFKEGDYGFYPCQECGCIMEDEFREPRTCSTCAPKVKERNLKGLLLECLDLASLPQNLRARILIELGAK